MKKIALGQMNVEYGNFEKNVRTGLSFIQKAVQAQCDIILLPELWSTGFDLSNSIKFHHENELLIDQLQNIANQSNLTICGSLIRKQENNFYNCFSAIQPHVSEVYYRKNHLFSPMKEDDVLSQGKDLLQFNSVLGKTGAAICFDLRFPEMFSKMNEMGTEFFLLPAHWPIIRTLHWDVLLQARAIETQSYMIAVNSVGISGKYSYAGHSVVISPVGDIILRAPSENDGVFICEIDPDLVQVCRRKFRIPKK